MSTSCSLLLSFGLGPSLMLELLEEWLLVYRQRRVSRPRPWVVKALKADCLRLVGLYGGESSPRPLANKE